MTNDQPRSDELAKPPVSTLVRFYDVLLEGDADVLVDLFSNEPFIDTPLQGEIRGEAALRQYTAEQKAWLEAHSARPEFFNAIITKERIVIELLLYLTQESNTFDLPVAIAADRDGQTVSAVRIYHSTWPLTGGHIIRAPILTPPAEVLDEPAVIQAYMDGIRKPDKELVLSLFVEDGYVRQPSGLRYKHVAIDGLRQFYDPALDAGGVILHHCTATFDGQAFAVEFICDEWANVKLPPQAGIAVYELAGPDKIRAARIYDDVNPPFE